MPAGRSARRSIGEFQKSDTWIHGAFALEQGFLFTAMLLSAAVVGVIERRWTVAAAWCAGAAVLSALGLMHSYQWTFGDTALQARAGVAVRDRLRRHVGDLPHGAVDDGRRRRALVVVAGR